MRVAAGAGRPRLQAGRAAWAHQVGPVDGIRNAIIGRPLDELRKPALLDAALVKRVPVGTP